MADSDAAGRPSSELPDLLRRVSELQVREQFYRTIVENTHDAISVNSDATLLYANKAFLELHGFGDESEVVGKPIVEFILPADRDLVRGRALARQRGEEVPDIYEYRALRSDGGVRNVQVVAVAITYENLPSNAIILRDITRRVRAEDLLDVRAKELERSNRDLEQFAYIASHDLQEPLRMVSSYVQLLARRYEDKLDKDADEFIDFTVDGVTRMQTLIDDLLAYSRIGTDDRPHTPVDCETVFTQVERTFEGIIAECAANVTRGRLPTIMGDATQITQLLQNLLGNAIKFRGDAAPRVHVSADRNGDLWRFSFQDNGIGIPPQHQQRIFEPFQRLHGRSEYPGTGIGLAICSKIAEQHEGRIWVESQAGTGTTVYFTLPAQVSFPSQRTCS